MVSSNIRIKRHFPHYLTLVFLFSLLFVSSVAPVAAQAAPIESCVLTPDLLSGQGFSLSGQGFSLSGQGFSLSGQGFSLSGQGFSLSGQGFSLSGQAAIDYATEVINNPVTPGQWLRERLGFFSGGSSFNTVPSAILVVDDFAGVTFPSLALRASDFAGITLPRTHGGEVILAVIDSINAANAALPAPLNIYIVPVDVSSAGVNYESDSLVATLESTVTSLRNAGINHFVYNLSFGLIACADPGNPAAGIPAFDFHQAISAVQQINTTQTNAVTPLLECVTDNGGNKFTAYFGYSNLNRLSVSIPVSNANNFSERTSQDQGQPRLFESGRQRNAFKVDFNGNPLTWRLTGPDGVQRTAIATRTSPRCAPAPTTPTQPITLFVDCVTVNPSGGFTARFGYNNPNPSNSVAIVNRTGGSNKFTPNPSDRGQTTTFLPGRHVDVFRVNFTSSITWSVNGVSVTANPVATPCNSDESVGIIDVIISQGLSPSLVTQRIQYLTSLVTNDPNLQPLRAYLRAKLVLSGNAGQPEQHVAIASAGNYRPWLGASPLSPAAWWETISTGASLDNNNNLWSYSQDGKVRAPGAGYPLTALLGANSFGAGTSFSAPILSSLVGVCATQPFGLSFDGTNPPIDLAVGFPNAIIGTANLAPLRCTVNRAPVAPDQAIATNEDTTVAVTLSATDLDNDVLTYAFGTTANGVLSGTAPALTYTPNANFYGSDSFIYQACDNKGACDSGTVNITVNPVNDAPIANAQSVIAIEDVPTAVTLTGSDIDSIDLTYTIVTPPVSGSLSGTGANLTYTSLLNFSGADGFTFQVCDGGNLCSTAFVSVTVTPVNDAPVAMDLIVVANEDTATGLTLNATDVDSLAFTFTVISQPVNGVLSGTIPDLLYTPNPDFNGTDSFNYQACDDQGACDTAVVNITVNPVNDQPVCTAVTPTLEFLWPTNGELYAVNVLGYTDLENDPISVVITSIYQDEPTNDNGDGNRPIDGEGVGTSTAYIRAERQGGGNGRIYHISYSATDSNGALCQGVVTVGVFSDQGYKGGAIDDGALYDSTVATTN